MMIAMLETIVNVDHHYPAHYQPVKVLLYKGFAVGACVTQIDVHKKSFMGIYQ